MKDSFPLKIHKRQFLLIIGIIFVSFNLRPAITSIGPLADLIRTDMSMTSSAVGFITTLPLLAFAILSPLAPSVGQRLGHERAILIGLVLVAAGVFIRSIDWVSMLFIGTGLAGLGIAIANVILPGIVKKYFPKQIGMMTGIYTTAMSVSAAIASGVSIPLAVQFGLGWKNALLVWGIFAIISIIIWLPQVRRRKLQDVDSNMSIRWQTLLQSKLAWYIAIFIGFQSFIFYSTIAWIPDIAASYGVELTTAGWLLALMQFVSMPASFVVPIIAVKFSNQKGIVKILGIIYLLGFIGLLLGGHHTLMVGAVILLGIAQGGSFSLALTFFALRTKNPAQTASLSGMAQSIGYLLAASGPLVMGYIHDITQGWTYPLIMLAIISIVMNIIGLGAGESRLIDE